MRLYIPPKRQRGVLLSKFIRDIVDDVFGTLVAELEFGLFFGRDDDVPDDSIVKFVFAAWVGRGDVGEDLFGVPVEEGFQVYGGVSSVGGKCGGEGRVRKLPASRSNPISAFSVGLEV